MKAGLRGTVTIAAVWLLVRLVMALLADPEISGDQTHYVWAARELVDGEGIELLRRSPGYVLFLAATLWLGPYGVYAVQSLMTLGAAVLTQRRLGFWEGVAIAGCCASPRYGAAGCSSSGIGPAFSG